MTDESRWTKPPGEHGEDPRDIDEEHRDAEAARLKAETRPVTRDQEPTGEQGATTDRPGVDPGGYPEERQLDD